MHGAAAHLSDATVEMHWGEAPVSAESLWTDTTTDSSPFDFPSRPELVRYLSQQFVERLCSATGLHSELVEEIERVIFNNTKPTEQLDCDSFQQLVDLYLEPIRQTRQGLQEAIEDISGQIVTEEGLIENLQKLTKAVTDCEWKIKATERQMKGLLPEGETVRSGKLSELEGLFTALSTTVDKEKRRLQRYSDLRSEIGNVRKTLAPQVLEKLKQKFHDLGMAEPDWSQFLLDYVGDVETLIQRYETTTSGLIRSLSATNPVDADTVPALPADKWPLDYLEKQKKALEAQVGIDTKNKNKYAALQSQLEQENRALQRTRMNATMLLAPRDGKSN